MGWFRRDNMGQGKDMSPTVFRYKNYRFFFFSREETRIHIHVASAEGEAKFWIEPKVVLAENYRFSPARLKELQNLIEERRNDIKNHWKKHFKS
jgi:hypothetical protein